MEEDLNDEENNHNLNGTNNYNDEFEEMEISEEKEKVPKTIIVQANRVIDISKASNMVWLVKLPSFLADFWASADQETELGSVIIDDPDPVTGISPVSLKLTSNLQSSMPQLVDNIPKKYDLKFISNPPGNLICFSEDENGNAVGIEGTVQHECNVVPLMDEEYLNIMRIRRQQAERPKRSTVMVEAKSNPQPVKHVVAPLITGGHLSVPVSKKRRNEDFRRDRLPKEAVIEMIFKAFEQKEYYSMKEILELTNQPTTWIKELIPEVCDYIQRGPYQFKYTLKPEYKNKV